MTRDLNLELYFREARHAVRAAGRKPLFLLGSALTLGVGLGVVTAFFALVNEVVLAPIARHRDQVVRIWKHDVERNVAQFPLSYPELQLWRARSRVFDSLAAITYANTATIALTQGDATIPVTMASVSAGFFGVLSDGPPLLGRWWTAADEGNTRELPAVVSERFWRATSGGDPGFVGRRLSWPGGGRAVTVVAVAPAGLEYPAGVDIWVPIDGFYASGRGEQMTIASHGFRQFHFVGRLAGGVTIDAVRAELDVLNRGIVAELPNEYRQMPVVVETLIDATLGPVRPLAWSLFAAAALVFLAAGSNVGAMLLMQATARQHETAVRASLGASRSRIAAQTFAETGVLAVCASVVGVVVAQLVVVAVRTIAATEISRVEGVTLNADALAFGGVAAVLWAAIIGTALVWRAGRCDRRGLTSHSSTRATTPRRALRAIVVAQVTAALVVAIAAGLLVRSLGELRAVERGFDTHNLAALQVLWPATHYPSPLSREALFTRIVERVSTLPGVASATATHLEPGTGATGMSAPMVYDGQQADEARRNPFATFEAILPSYFDTLGIPITRGRRFAAADDEGAPLVAIVSESVAARFWPGQDPIGKRVRLSPSFPWTTVVGVAADARYRELTRNWLTVYFPARQSAFFSPGWLLVRTSAAAPAPIDTLRRVINDMEPLSAVVKADTVGALAAREMARPIAAVTLAILFALVAIVVTAAGVYSVFSYDVTLRARELAVHAAVGASPRQLLQLVLRSAALVAIAGVAGGWLIATVTTSYLQLLLFQIRPLDVVSFAIAAIILVLLVIIASLRPAARAAGTDPVVLMRSE